jgi:1-pyrroline dehydrogenase
MNPPEYGHWIDGAWTDTGDLEPIINPATEAEIARVSRGTAADVDAAVRAARRAVEGAWGDSTPGERSRALWALAGKLRAHQDELAGLERDNVGKPLGVALDDVDFAADNLEFFAGAARTLEGRAGGEYIRGHSSVIRREPVGVVVGLAPWNYPLLMLAWKIAPALAAGNAVVLKPSEVTPLSALRVAELSRDILPAGVLNVVTGHGEPVGAGLVAHEDVDLVALTGDHDTGRKIMRAAADTVKRLHLELGGKAPMLVFADADLEAAALGARRSAFYNSGQDCTAACRVLVHESILDAFLERLKAHVEAIRVGDPAGDVDNGPLVSRAQLEKVAGMVERARLEGARVLTGGSRLEGRGFFYRPTVLTGVNQSSEIIQREVFGPVVTVQSFSDEQNALELAHGVPYALTASVWTTDTARAARVTRALRFGTVWVNQHTRLTPEMPHGGFKQSGFGKDMSIYALEEYTRIKHVMTRFA